MVINLIAQTYVAGVRADYIVCAGQHVDVLDHTQEGFLRGPGRFGSRLSNFDVVKDCVVRVLCVALLQNLR